MILKPIAPWGAISLASFISLRMDLKFASTKLVVKSGSLKPIWAAEIMPMPPAFATAPASLCRLMPTPIPPWMIGFSTTKSPITNGFNSLITFS